MKEYGLIECADPAVLDCVRRTRAGIHKCSANHQTHYADVAAQWGRNSWMNDLYFGLHGGLFVADQREHEVFINEMRKIAPFVLDEGSDLEIVPYAVSEDGTQFLRNDTPGLDFDRCAEYVLMIIRTYEWTGDRTLIEELYPVMCRVLRWLARQCTDGDLLLEGRSLPAPIVGVGSCASVSYIGDSVKNDYKDFGASLFYYHVLRRLAMAERILGMPREAEARDRAADALRSAINAIMWNEATGGYLAWIDETGQRMDNWITGNNLHAVYCGLANDAQARAIMATLQKHRDILIDQVPCRVSLNTYPSGYSSNPDFYYWNAGCWTLVSAPVMLGYRRMGDVQGAAHVMDVLASALVNKTQYGFYESYWSNTRQNNACEGLLMNNGGVLWGFHEGVLGIRAEGDELSVSGDVPANVLPAKARIRYRGADVEIAWSFSKTASVTANGERLEPANGIYTLPKPRAGSTLEVKIGVTAV